MTQELRQVARAIFTEALAACEVRDALEQAVRAEGSRLWIGDCMYDLAGFSEVRIVAIGKAGAALFDGVRPLLPSPLPVAAVVSAPTPPHLAGASDRYFAGGHPLPNADSLAAAQAALELVRGSTPRTLVLFLISGGASAMFEAPLRPDVALGDLLDLNRKLVGSGATIAEINCVRKHLSAVKGGRLLAAAGAATCVSLLVSDVPAGRLDALGSGPTLPDPTTAADCHRIVETYLGGTAGLPPALASLLLTGLPETLKPGELDLSRAQSLLLLDNASLLRAASDAAQRRGFHVEIDNACDEWEYPRAAEYLLDRLRKMHREGAPVCLLSGGEVTVRLPPEPGNGGRNQQWVLHCARQLERAGKAATVLSAGSDGVDGSSPAAGAVADETTWARARAAGLDPGERLASFDAFPVFHQLGDAVRTGPTGNNLRDLRLLLAHR